MPRDAIEVQRLILLNMDPPEHTRVRGIVQRGFTPRAIRALEDTLRRRAHSIVQEALTQTGPFDFVTEVASELPLQAIAELIGIPQEDRRKIFDWSNKMISYDDPEYAITEEVGQESATELISYAMNMAADRKQCPAKDIVTQLVAAEDEGNLTSDEFGFFVLMLAVAGNETTRNATTHGMHAFLTHPDQWDLYKRERPSTTAEEVVRRATPVVSFQRTATQDTELGGAQIAGAVPRPQGGRRPLGGAGNCATSRCTTAHLPPRHTLTVVSSSRSAHPGLMRPRQPPNSVPFCSMYSL